MKARLTALDAATGKQRIRLRKLPVVVGRSEKADVHVVDCWISRVHCEISELDGTLVVRDLESTNGTLVNGEHVHESLLMPGDRLTVGISSFRVEYKRAPSPSDASSLTLQCS